MAKADFWVGSIFGLGNLWPWVGSITGLVLRQSNIAAEDILSLLTDNVWNPGHHQPSPASTGHHWPSAVEVLQADGKLGGKKLEEWLMEATIWLMGGNNLVELEDWHQTG